MPSSTDERTVGLISDYCGLLREAAFMLTLLCQAPAAERRDMFDALVGVESDSSATYIGLVHALADSSQTPTSWGGEAGRFTASLHATFGALVNTGAKLLDVTADEIAPNVVRRCGRIEDATKTLYRSWQHSQEPIGAERLLRGVQLDVIALDRSLESSAVAILGRAQRRPTVGRTPSPSR